MWQGMCMVGCVHGMGACVAWGVHGKGRRACQERRPLQRAVRIPLECILVRHVSVGLKVNELDTLQLIGWL